MKLSHLIPINALLRQHLKRNNCNGIYNLQKTICLYHIFIHDFLVVIYKTFLRKKSIKELEVYKCSPKI